MRLPKFLTSVTPFSKILALSLFIILPIIAFLFGIYYEQVTRNGFPNLFCRQWETICDPTFEDANDGCAPKKICADSKDNLKRICEGQNGIWFDKYKECEITSEKGFTKDSCTALGGKYNECASLCRHDSPAVSCVTACVTTCQFQ
jgi:hypothetical protein